MKVYTDEDISGTNIKKREGFKSMVEDALKGKIDLIVTKSVSRFVRNDEKYIVFDFIKFIYQNLFITS